MTIDKCTLNLLFLLFIVQLTGQDRQSRDSVNTQKLRAVTITASKIESNVQQLPYAVSVYSQRETDVSKQQLSLQEYIVQMPGVFTQNANNFAQDLRISIRGFGARSAFGIRGIKLIVDGIPETTPDGQGQLDNLNLGTIDRIEVIKGSSSSLYGNASGGVISIDSKTDFKKPFTALKATTGSYGMQNYQFTTGLGRAKTKILLHANYGASEGYRENSSFEQWNFNGNLSHRPHDRVKFNFLINYSNSPFAQDAGGLNIDEASTDPSQAREANLTFKTEESIDQLKIGSSIVWNPNPKSELKTYAFYSFRDFNGKLPFEFGGQIDLQRNYAGHGSSFQYKTPKNTFQVGYDLAYQNDSRQRFRNLEGSRGNLTLDQKERFTNIGLYMVDHYSWDKWYFTGGVRFDYNKLEAIDGFLTDQDDSGSIDLNAFNPSLGISYALLTNHNVYVNFSTSYETPALSELSSSPDGEQGFNKTLKPQKANSIELGFKAKYNNGFRYQLNYFYVNTKDDLVPFELALFPGRSFFRNAGSTKRHGVEIDATYLIDRNWQLQANYAYSDFEYDEYLISGDVFNGKTLPGIPKHQGGLSIRYYNENGIYGVLQNTIVGKLYADDANTVSVRDYGLTNLRVGYGKSLGKIRLHPFFGINNLLDTQYFDNIRINAFGGRYYEPAPGIQVFGGMQLQF